MALTEWDVKMKPATPTNSQSNRSKNILSSILMKRARTAWEQAR